jgi:hypothetical protein
MGRAAAVGIGLAAAVLAGGCSSSTTVGEGEPDLEAAREFDRHPLYWAGERFEDLDLEHVQLDTGVIVSFIYGTCEIPAGSDGGCAPPLQLQITPLCDHLDAVARADVWRRRQVRGAPVGTIDGAPVLFTSRVQVKVYRGQDSDPGIAMRALQALHSVNDVAPVLDRADTIPAAPRSVLSGEERCGS